jgi:hypothetical protein
MMMMMMMMMMMSVDLVLQIGIRASTAAENNPCDGWRMASCGI